MSTLSQFFGGGIKSVQRGFYNGGSATNATITISPVNTSKSFCSLLSYGSIGGGVFNAASMTLVNSSTIEFAAHTGALHNSKISWEVIEFY